MVATAHGLQPHILRGQRAARGQIVLLGLNGLPQEGEVAIINDGFVEALGLKFGFLFKGEQPEFLGLGEAQGGQATPRATLALRDQISRGKHKDHRRSHHEAGALFLPQPLPEGPVLLRTGFLAREVVGLGVVRAGGHGAESASFIAG